MNRLEITRKIRELYKTIRDSKLEIAELKAQLRSEKKTFTNADIHYILNVYLITSDYAQTAKETGFGLFQVRQVIDKYL